MTIHVQPGTASEYERRLGAIFELHRCAEREQVGASPVRWCVECGQTYPCPTVRLVMPR